MSQTEHHLEVQGKVRTVQRSRVLAFGGAADCDAFLTAGLLEGASILVTVEFRQVTETSLALLAPRLILSPLFWEGKDVLDLAARLQALRYEGLYRVVTEPLPRPDLITREVAACAPDLDFQILELTTLQSRPRPGRLL